MTIDDGVAYGETFDSATAALRFEGAGVRLDGIDDPQGRDGPSPARRYVGWDGTYSFNADAPADPGRARRLRRLPAGAAHGHARLHGVAAAARSSSRRYDVRGRIATCSSRTRASARCPRRARRCAATTLNVSSSRRRRPAWPSRAPGAGRRCPATTPATSRCASPTRRSIRTSACSRRACRRSPPRWRSGTVRRQRRARQPRTACACGGAVDRLDLQLFDYQPAQRRPHRARPRPGRAARRSRCELVGEDTQLEVSGDVDLRDRRIALRADGDANLGILQAFFRDIRGSGARRGHGRRRRAAREPVVPGSADDRRTAGSGTSRCRTRSTRSTAASRSTGAASASTTSRRRSAAATCGSAAGSGSTGFWPRRST